MVKRNSINIFLSALLCIFALIIISPVICVVLLSFGDGVRAYIDFYVWNPQYVRALTNSILMALATSVGATAVSTLAAYVFAKVKFRGRNVLFYLYIIVMMMPFQVTLLPQYIVSRNMGIYDTLFSVILPGIFSPFSVFLLTQIMRSVPNELIEAARLDTDSTLRIIVSITVPAVKSGIVCTWALTFTEVWNMVAEPLVLIETKERYPLAVILSEIESGDVLGFAAASVFILLPLLIFAFFEEEIMEGLEAYQLK